jgi:ComF family protein
MHRLKLFDKGYNHADVLAKKLSGALNVPRWTGINRDVETPPLEGLSKKERRTELKDAFKLTKKPPESVALIDDVFTTGATASEITRLLKRNGCKHVSVWALARTPLN